jgi:FkbM family methyltransferase
LPFLGLDAHIASPMRAILKRFARALGVNFFTNERFGVELPLDLARLTAGDPLRTIFDVGGNFGQTALHFATAFPSAEILTFEPVPSSFSRLREATAHCDRIKLFNLALGETAGAATINLTPSAGSNTLLATNAATGTVAIQVDTLDRVADTHGIRMIDLLKIDVEGYELHVLKGGEQLLREGRVRYVFAECVFATDADSPHTSFFDLHAFLESRGFCFVSYYPESFALRRGVALGNALFALRSSLPESVPGKVRNIV